MHLPVPEAAGQAHTQPLSQGTPHSLVLHHAWKLLRKTGMKGSPWRECTCWSEDQNTDTLI